MANTMGHEKTRLASLVPVRERQREAKKNPGLKMRPGSAECVGTMKDRPARFDQEVGSAGVTGIGGVDLADFC